jgi:hypothetical protein
VYIVVNNYSYISVLIILYKKLLHKSEFGQAHCVEWFKSIHTNFSLPFLDTPTSFYEFWKFTLFFCELKQLKNDLKSPDSVGPKSACSYSTWPGGLPRVVGRKVGWSTAWRPGPTSEVARASGALRRGHRVQPARGTAQWHAHRRPCDGLLTARSWARVPRLSGGWAGQGERWWGSSRWWHDDGAERRLGAAVRGGVLTGGRVSDNSG